LGARVGLCPCAGACPPACLRTGRVDAPVRFRGGELYGRP